MTQPPAVTAAIRRYYEQNTRLFLAFGQPPTDTIHRALWAEGITTHRAALNYSNELLWQALREVVQRDAPAPVRLIDLGCGVGGSLFYLLTRVARPALALGCTLSPAQARLAAHRAQRLQLPHPVGFVEADFHWAPAAAGADLVYSVEAFGHAADPDQYFATAARLLRPGGRLILCDDFRARPDAALAARARRWVAAYQAGWQIPNLQTVDAVTAGAEAHGLRLISGRDLTALIRLRAWPDALAELALALGRRLPSGHAFIPSMVGSLALQQCLRAGWVAYHFLIFEKPA